jgi:hypothetical protein
VSARASTVLTVGEGAADLLRQVADAAGVNLPSFKEADPVQGEVFLWSRRAGTAPQRVRIKPTQTERQRHRRKYAEGELPPERSFYFRGPESRLNLRAQNLQIFLQLAEGVDDETWSYHLRRGDVSRWFREGIKDDALAAEAERVERLPNLPPAEGRELIKAAIERDYTLPAAPLPVPGAR